MKLLIGSLALMVFSVTLCDQPSERVIRAEIVVNKNVEAVWAAWTTEEGIKGFFAPDCQIDLRVGGDFELYFAPTAEKGKRGAEGTKILALQPLRMLSFTWNNPPSVPEIRWQYTSVVVRFEQISDNATKVTLTQSGWGEGKEWDQAFKYFEAAWQSRVLTYLKRSLESGPIDWKKPPSEE
jgi:uncharacterized protein YndB with AHSA1/START domain